MFNSNIWPNAAPLQDIRLQNLSDLERSSLRSLKVKCDDVIGRNFRKSLEGFKTDLREV